MKIFPIRAIQEEIAAGHTGAVDRAKGANGVILKCGDLFLRQLRGNDELRAAFEIFCRVIVVFAMRDDFAGNGRANLFIAQH